ncbi:MAG: vitamin K epoxide reductase family protein [Candidatus Gracilibacteria bacterium]|nr:vitamin K epoxide reductase family protein [Candidatus Gracilibacteria bacterium]
MKTKLIIIIILSIIAIFNASYLTIGAYDLLEAKRNSTGIIPFVCDINSTFSCSSLFNYSFTRIFGVPFPLIALFVYPMIILIAILGLTGVIKKHFSILFYLGIGGFLFNSYFIVNEIMVNTYCLLCLMCTFIIITIAILSKYGEVQNKQLSLVKIRI